MSLDVAMLVTDGDETFEADAETEKMLLDAIAQCNAGKITQMSELVAAFRTRD